MHCTLAWQNNERVHNELFVVFKLLWYNIFKKMLCYVCCLFDVWFCISPLCVFFSLFHSFCFKLLLASCLFVFSVHRIGRFERSNGCILSARILAEIERRSYIMPVYNLYRILWFRYCTVCARVCLCLCMCMFTGQRTRGPTGDERSNEKKKNGQYGNRHNGF